MKYKVGDKVRIREDLFAWKEYDGCYIVPSMIVFLGRTVTIHKVLENLKRYEIKEDNGAWNWTDDMFESLEGKNLADETNDSGEWVLCRDDAESHAEAIEATGDIDCLLEAKFREAVDKITPEELKEIILRKIDESVDDMSGDMFQDILAEALS